MPAHLASFSRGFDRHRIKYIKQPPLKQCRNAGYGVTERRVYAICPGMTVGLVK
jgi:hypothetical protein